MAMTRGQDSLMIDMLDEVAPQEDADDASHPRNLKVLRASDEELQAHEAYVNALNKGANLWQKISALPEAE